MGPPWIIVGMIATVGVMAVGVLYVLAARVRTECDLHDLRLIARQKRREQMRRLALLGHGGDLAEVSDAGDSSGEWDVEIVEDAA